MDELRLILLGVGALVVAGVYLYSRYSQNANDESSNRPVRGAAAGNSADSHGSRREPAVEGDMQGDDIDDDLPSLSLDGNDERIHESGTARHQREKADEADRRGKPGDSSVESQRDSKEKLIVLNILPVERNGRFRGNDLLEVFDRAGLEYGRFDVFHRLVETPDGLESVFSVASATEPGSFEISEMADESFKGLTMFMLLPGPQGGVAAFADMLATARRMAQQLDADVTDRNRSTMTRQTAHHIREEIIAFEHQFRREPGRSQ